MADVEQVRSLAGADMGGRVFLRVAAVSEPFQELCSRLKIVPETGRDETDTYEYATLKWGGHLFQLEKYRKERGYALLLLSEDPSVRATARQVLSEIGVSQHQYSFMDEGYHDYPRRSS